MLAFFCFLTIALGVVDAYYTGERFKTKKFFGELNTLVGKAYWKFGKGGVYAAIAVPTLAITGVCGYFGQTALIAFYAGMRTIIALKQFVAYRKGL